jgi:hypothetical protein
VEDLTRRRAALVIATTALVTWLGQGRRAQVSADRLRAGGELELRCEGATHFRLEYAEYGSADVPASAGVARLRIPFSATRDEWTPLRCVPCDDRGPMGPATIVRILTAPVRFGA